MTEMVDMRGNLISAKYRWEERRRKKMKRLSKEGDKEERSRKDRCVVTLPEDVI